MNVQSQVMGTNVLKNLRELGAGPGDLSTTAEAEQAIGAVENGEI